MRLLESGIVDGVVDDNELQDLRDENRQLRDDLAVARRETLTAKREVAHALGALRKQLAPLYRALQAVFGELDAAGIDTNEAAPQQADSRTAAIWNQWKQKMGGQAAQIIDVLQLHRDMNAQQLAIAIGIHKKNIPQLIYKLNRAGLIAKIGDRYSLKSL